jgi:hypothetical protein
MVPADVLTALAMPKELWKIWLTMYKLNDGGSLGSGVQVMVTVLALVMLVGVVKVRALTRGARRAKMLSVEVGLSVQCVGA